MRFLLISLGIIFGLHVLLYATTVRFAAISDPAIRRMLFWLLILLGLSFAPGAILMRTRPGIVSTIVYVAAAFWMGLFIYLLMASALSWVVFGLGKLTGLAPNMRVVFLGACIAAAGITVYGTLRAEYPSLKPVTVTLKDLPKTWRGETIVQLSDVHLGAIRGSEFLNRIVTKVNAVHPDLILITGDLFDGMGGRPLSDFIAPLNRLEAARGIFFVTGNHEGYLGLKAPLATLSQTKIHVLNNEIVDIDGLQIIGIPFPEHGRKNDVRGLLTDPDRYDPSKPSILMYHTPSDIETNHADRESQQTHTYWRPNTDMAFARSMGIDLQLSGHTHRGQFFPFTLLTRYIYKGFDYGLHRIGDFQIYITSGAGTWGPPMRVACPPEIPVITLN